MEVDVGEEGTWSENGVGSDGEDDEGETSDSGDEASCW